jgi:hypothetical protein
MHPESDENLERFLRSYKRSGFYFFAPAFMAALASKPVIIRDHHIIKRELVVREAWQIGRNDPDCVAIHEDLEPIIPVGQESPPVAELIRWKRERSGVRGSAARGAEQKTGRNEPCPCGSGKKYKKCHGA